MRLRIKELREECMLTQNELAEKLGNAQKNISNWETGKSEPDLETVTKLADLFDVKLDELFGRETTGEDSPQADTIDRMLNRRIKILNKEQKNALLVLLKSFTED